MKRIFALILIFVMAISICASATSLEFMMGYDKMYENNESIETHTLETAPYTKNDRTMVPVRIISERFGAQVGWNGETNKVTIVKEDKTIVLTLGNTTAYVNGEATTLDAAPEEINGRTMVPLRFISETLGMKVKYVAPAEHVYITNEEAVMTVNGNDIFADTFASILPYIGVDPSNADLEPVLSEITELIGSVFTTATYYRNLGADSIVDISADFRELANEYNAIDKKTFLVSPLIELLDCDVFVTEYINASTDDEDIASAKKQYEENYVTAKHVLVKFEGRTKAEAKKIINNVLKKANKGEDFDKLIKEYCEDPGMKANPDGYTFTKGEMVKEFETAAFALKEGKISSVVETSYGYHIIKREPLHSAAADILNGMAQQINYNNVLETALNESEIVIHKTPAEIAAMIK